MSYLETVYKPAQVESLHLLKPPTCEKYEPNFEKVFGFAQSGIMNGKDIVSPEGKVVASIWDDELLFEVKKWVLGVFSNATRRSILVKNPNRLPENEGLIGIRNGLVCSA